MDTIRWPLTNNVIRRNSESNTFGMVRKNANGTPRAHQGWDFYALPGTPCYAISDGKVVFSGTVGAFGMLLVIEFVYSGQKLYAAYAHLSQILVSGGTVSKAQKVALTGNSGNASSMTGLDQHLHFEIRTTPLPGLGLSGRKSPLSVYKQCPLKALIYDPV